MYTFDYFSSITLLQFFANTLLCRKRFPVVRVSSMQRVYFKFGDVVRSDLLDVEDYKELRHFSATKSLFDLYIRNTTGEEPKGRGAATMKWGGLAILYSSIKCFVNMYIPIRTVKGATAGAHMHGGPRFDETSHRGHD